MGNTSNNNDGMLTASGATCLTTHATIPQGPVTPQRISVRTHRRTCPSGTTTHGSTTHGSTRGGRNARSYLHNTSSKAAKLGLAGAALSLVATSIASVSPAYAIDLTPKGIDVASHQHPFGERINWLKVRFGGYSFAIIKATEGTGYVNPFFEQNRDEAHLAGMIVGSYHYARPNQDPIKRALRYADTIKCQKRFLEMPPVLDLEETGGRLHDHP